MHGKQAQGGSEAPERDKRGPKCGTFLAQNDAS